MDANNISAVALKLPTFWAERSAVWFLQAEAQFATRNITADDTKYYYVVAALDQDIATRVLDLLEHPPAENKYAALKARLLETFTLTESQRAAALLNIQGLGDDKPSLLMDRMLALLGDHKPCFLFKELFLKQLPPDMRSHLVHLNLGDYRELAQAADRLWISRSPDPALNAVAAHPTPAPRKSQFHVRQASRKSKQVVKEDDVSEICYYHQRFGAAAKQCRPPCNFSRQGNGPAGRH